MPCGFTVRGAASWNSTPSLAAPPQVRCHGWHWRWSWLHATCAGNASMNARRGACVCHLQTSGWSRGRLIVCPRQALIEWFPDRKGLASSLAIAGFGSGALVFAPLMNNLSVRAVCTVAPGVSAAWGQQVCVCVCGCVCVCVCVWLCVWLRVCVSPRSKHSPRCRRTWAQQAVSTSTRVMAGCLRLWTARTRKS